MSDPVFLIGHKDKGVPPVLPGCVPGVFVYSRAYPTAEAAKKALESVISTGWAEAYVFSAVEIAKVTGRKREPENYES